MASYWCSPSPKMGCFVPDLSSAQTNGAAAAAPAARKLRRVVGMDIDRCSLSVQVGAALPSLRRAFARCAGPKPGAPARKACPQYFLLRCFGHRSVRIDDELFGSSLIKVFVALRRLVKRDDGRVDGLGDLHFIVQNGHHQPAIVTEDRALASGERAGLGPAEPDADAEIAGFGRVIHAARIVSNIEPGNTEVAAGAGHSHQRIQHGCGTLDGGFFAVAARFETDAI